MNGVQRSDGIGALYLVICAVLWSMAGVLIKVLPWNSVVISALRGGIACVVLYLELRRNHIKRPVINRDTITSGLLLGVCTTLFVMANKLTTAANAIVLQSSNPIFVLLFCSAIFKQRFQRRDYIAVFFTLAGITLFFFEEISFKGMAGNILAVISAVMLAGVFIKSSAAKTLSETLSGVMLGHLTSFIIGIPFIVLYPPQLDPSCTAVILVLGVFQLGISYVLFSYASRRCSPLVISLLGMLEPILNPIWVAIFVGEIPAVSSLIGGGIILLTLSIWCAGNSMGRREKTAVS